MIVFHSYYIQHTQKQEGEKCCFNRVPIVGGWWEIVSSDESVRAHYR